MQDERARERERGRVSDEEGESAIERRGRRERTIERERCRECERELEREPERHGDGYRNTTCVSRALETTFVNLQQESELMHKVRK